MKLIDMAPWIAIALTLILSILVPLFTQIANNNFQLKLRKTDSYNKATERKLLAYESFFQTVGGCILYAKGENIIEAGASIQRLYAYFPEDEWWLLDQLFDDIKTYQWGDAKERMKMVSRILAQKIQEIDSLI